MEHVSFDVARGIDVRDPRWLGVGKSSLLRHLIGLARPQSGRIDIDGVGEPHFYQGRRRSACSSSPARSSSSLTLAENLALPVTM